ncbi:glyceraldehyde-3-phosphate dehydrogenase [Corynebacterium sp. UMB9976]|uniref:glyceraldehyde-3-phosphate dehydrogenase n=1 Tax=Corynebacterium sp. UMB9976 TaxID=3046354 RepID=UPI00254CFFBF|nr:glyceraldehyde-3-phosphate dehydrogenase [Corynebacterium sp. UMB9976]MDK6302309.1 glyceraldehyde-3-phosphate dehydrogenase [Corynebacterium sp. UMB9976]
MSASASIDKQQADWNERVALAEKMIPLLGQLRREKNVVTSIFGRQLINVAETDILKQHRFARRITNNDLPIAHTMPILERIAELDLNTVAADLGALATAFEDKGGDFGDTAAIDEFLKEQFADVIGTRGDTPTTDVVLYGFGRIGRLLARILLAQSSEKAGPRLRAIVVRKNSEDDLQKRASLLRRDSVHGSFDGTIWVDEENNVIWANGTPIQVIYANKPSEIDYTRYGIDNAIVVDNTGVWRDREGLGQHLQAKGVARALLTAPGKGDIKNLVFGINHNDVDLNSEDDRILSAASCTTNGITPVLKVVNDKWGVDHGHVETVHAFTNDQNLIDNFHKGERRGRAATLNMVLTETGAAKAVSKALPEFEGKLTGNAIRVPTPDVSMAVLNLSMSREVTKDEVNNYLRDVSLVSELRQQVDYIDSPEVVSTDFVGSTHAGVVDGRATIAAGKNLVLYVWYDNEFGYSCQVVRIIEQLASAQHAVVPTRAALDTLN